MNCKYRVEVWEHERGWGAKCDFTEDFDSYKRALDYRDKFNSRNTAKNAPDWYMIAHDPYLVDLDKN